MRFLSYRVTVHCCSLTLFLFYYRPEEDVDAEALELMGQGKRNLVVGDPPAAVQCFQEACELLYDHIFSRHFSYYYRQVLDKF